MEVQEFVTNILRQLESSLSDASKQSGQKEFVFDKAVSFDLAVTHTTNKEGDVGGKLKTGIKIVDFEIGGKGKFASGQEIVQRIQFSVNIWDKQDDTGIVNTDSYSFD